MTNSQTDNGKTATPRAENRPAGSGPRSAGGGVKNSLATACPHRETHPHTAPGPKAGKSPLSNRVTEVTDKIFIFQKNKKNLVTSVTRLLNPPFHPLCSIFLLLFSM